MTLRFALVLVAAVPLAGCDLISSWFQQSVDLPITLASPPQDFSVTDAVNQAQGEACATTDSPSCTALTAICNTKNGATCPDDGMPDEFPIEVTVGADTVNANDLMVDMGVSKATELKVGLPVDVGGALADEGVQSPDAIQNVSITDVNMKWPSNTLTFDAPPLDLYVTTDDVGDGDAIDADALITAGTVKKVGTVGIDLDGDGTFDIGQKAGSTDDVPLVFVKGGEDLLTAAVRAPKFTIVTAVPDGKGMKLGTKQGDAGTALKPQGDGSISLEATLVYTVSAADIVGGVQ